MADLARIVDILASIGRSAGTDAELRRTAAALTLDIAYPPPKDGPEDRRTDGS